MVDSDRKCKFQRFWPARSDCNNLALIVAVAAIIFGLWWRKKRGIGEQLNCFWNIICLKPFSWAKNGRKLFSNGKSRGPLLARAVLKSSHCQKTFLDDACMYIVLHFCFSFFFRYSLRHRNNIRFRHRKAISYIFPDYTYRLENVHLGISPLDSKWKRDLKWCLFRSYNFLTNIQCYRYCHSVSPRAKQ